MHVQSITSSQQRSSHALFRDGRQLRLQLKELLHEVGVGRELMFVAPLGVGCLFSGKAQLVLQQPHAFREALRRNGIAIQQSLHLQAGRFRNRV